MRKSFVYRLYPNRVQARELEQMLETHRRLYNDMLDERQLAYDTCGVTIRYGQQSSRFKHARKLNKWYAGINFSSAQATMRRLDKAYQRFFKHGGFPRFRGRGRFKSVEFPKHGDGCRLKDNRLRLQHVGVVKVKLHRPVEGVIKTIRVKLDAGKWYVIVSCDLGDAPKPRSGDSIGIDVGLAAFLTDSNGGAVANPKHLRDAESKLRRSQRAVSRKTNKRSKRRAKAVRRLQRIYAKVRNQRKDFHHKTARVLVDQFAVIAAENLTVKNMVKNRRLAKSISDAGWSAFLTILQSKAESAGSQVILVNPAGTSQECSTCGEIVKKSLSVRVHRCKCGCVLDRDHNAARNILARAEPSNAKVVVG